MVTDYPVADPDQLERWLEYERVMTRCVRDGAEERLDLQRRILHGQWQHRWEAGEVSAEQRDGVMENIDRRTAKDAGHFSWYRQHLFDEGPAMLSEVLAHAPDDPDGGHRPIELGRDGGQRGDFWFAVVCLDCDFRWLPDGSPSHQVARTHRAAHLDPPARALCEQHPLPLTYWLRGYEPGRLRRDQLASPNLSEDWPPPAIGTLVDSTEWPDGPATWKVCASCWEGRQRRDAEPGASVKALLITPDRLPAPQAPTATPWTMLGGGLLSLPQPLTG